MRKGVWLLVLGAIGSTWWWQQGARVARRRVSHGTERWLDANHAHMQIGGQWQDVPLMPLADHLCRSGQPLFERYCNEPQDAKAR